MMTPQKAWSTMPKKIKVGFVTYSVVACDALSYADKAAIGMARLLRAEIRLVKGMSAAVTANVLLHEINHCICFHHGVDPENSGEEQYVNQIANGTCMVMVDNPGLFPWIKKMLESK